MHVKGPRKDILEDFIHATESNMLMFAQVRQHGEVIADCGILPVSTRYQVMSVAKSFTAIGYGVAEAEGIIRRDDRVAAEFPEYLPKNASQNLLDIRVEHLLTMTSGLKDPLFFADMPERYRVKDWLSHYFSAEFVRAPGERFQYSNFNTYLIGRIIEKRTGLTLFSYMKNRGVFDKLHIGNPDWLPCPMGHTACCNGLMLTIDEMGRFGEMILRQGEFEGERIVSREFIQDATSYHVPSDTFPVPCEDLHAGYGYGFWMNQGRPGTCKAYGKYGQFILILPEKDAVICTMAMNEDDSVILNAVWEHLYDKL